MTILLEADIQYVLSNKSGNKLNINIAIFPKLTPDCSKI
jgi:hypothetical protein